MRSRLSLVLLVLLLGCKEELGPEPAVCVTEPANLDFGDILPPLQDLIPKTVVKTVTLTNTSPIVATHGNADITGTVVFHMETSKSNPPSVHLVPEALDPEFEVVFRESITFKLGATLVPATTTGDYFGTIEFGSPCATVPFNLYVTAREEPPPVYLSGWGSRGSGRGQFEFPESAAMDSRGNIYVVDRGNARVQKFDSQGNYLLEWNDWEQVDRAGGVTTFQEARGIAVDGEDNVYVTDIEQEQKRARVTKFDSEGNYIKTAGIFQGGSVLKRPWHIAVDGAQNMYLADKDDFSVVKMRFTGTGTGFEILQKWGPQGDTAVPFCGPLGVAVDTDGNAYVSDWCTYAIYKFAPDGSLLFKWGVRGTEARQFDKAGGVAVGPQGRVYVADTDNDRIQRFDDNGAFLTEWGRPGTAGELTGPSDVVVHPNGVIYVVDSRNHRIRMYADAQSSPQTAP